MQKGGMDEPAGSAREQYTRPELKCWGTVADLTRAGGSNPGGDLRNGSGPANPFNGGPPGKGQGGGRPN